MESTVTDPISFAMSTLAAAAVLLAVGVDHVVADTQLAPTWEWSSAPNRVVSQIAASTTDSLTSIVVRLAISVPCFR